MTFFGTIERLYSFFSSSTNRWNVFNDFVPNTLKCMVDTRWSARNNAVSIVLKNFDKIVEALDFLSDPEKIVDTVCADAGILKLAICNFSFLVNLYFCFTYKLKA